MIQANFRRICKESKNWEHKGAYIYPPICTKRLIFGKWTFFCFALSEYAFQSHNFTNWNFCDVTLIFSIYAFLHHAYISSFFYLRLESAFRCFRCACTLINNLNWFFFIPHGSPPQTKISVEENKWISLWTNFSSLCLELELFIKNKEVSKSFTGDSDIIDGPLSKSNHRFREV